MSAVAQTLNDFGKSVGLPSLRFSPQGAAALDVQGLGTLGFEAVQQEVIIFLARTIPPFTEGALHRALQSCQPSHGYPFTVQAALKGDDLLLFVARLPETEFSLPNIDRAVRLLEQLHKHALTP